MKLNIFAVLMVLFIYAITLIGVYLLYNFIVKFAKTSKSVILLNLIFLVVIIIITIPIIGFFVSVIGSLVS